uniref:Uncharacterized protein n=1 Tax=Anguilla anguilla TaxID=7936 RepID=A0A0E9RQ31_ANGAN
MLISNSSILHNHLFIYAQPHKPEFIFPNVCGREKKKSIVFESD